MVRITRNGLAGAVATALVLTLLVVSFGPDVPDSVAPSVEPNHVPADNGSEANPGNTGNAAGPRMAGGIGSLSISGEHKVFVLPIEFGDQIDPRAGGPAGPLHNQIPKPDRATDNTTYWQPDFSQAHYQKSYFGDQMPSFRNYYHDQSKGRFEVDGTVNDWVKVPYNQAHYNPRQRQSRMDLLIKDAIAAWVAVQKAAGKTDEGIKATLAKYDTWNRMTGADGPDGEIDHVALIHAGVGAESLDVIGPAGNNVIWSHRSSLKLMQQPAVPVGNTGIAINDYIIQAENSGIGVVTHEFGHDLGLPDLYDTANFVNPECEANVSCSDNAVAFWSIMNRGSSLSESATELDTMPSGLGPWEKLLLGWANYKTVRYGENKRITLRAAGDKKAKEPDVLVVELPKDPAGNERYYLVENRRHVGYDRSLKVGPHFKSRVGSHNVTRMRYEEGMLVWYWDRGQKDNDVVQHRGHGLVLPVDAHQNLIRADDGRVLPPHVQMYDAPFSFARTKPISLTWDRFDDNDKALSTAKVSAETQPGVSTFDDRQFWYNPEAWQNSVEVPKTGTVIKLSSELVRGKWIMVDVTFLSAEATAGR